MTYYNGETHFKLLFVLKGGGLLRRGLEGESAIEVGLL